MPILTERKTWRQPRPENEPRRSSDLTPAEQTNVRAAIRFLRTRLGGLGKLAAATGAKPDTLSRALRDAVSAGIALRVARAAGVPVEEVLAGRYPVAGTCPHCGRGP